MSESPKVELVFQYTLQEDGTYAGSADVVETQTGQSLRPPFYTAVARPEWVKFVVDQIREHPEAEAVIFNMKRPGKVDHRYAFGQRTVEKIRDETLTAEDFIL